MKKRIYKGYQPTQIKSDLRGEGLSIEEEIQQALLGNQQIEITSALQYDAEKDGVKPETDIRTDRFELALEATDKFAKSLIAASKMQIDNHEENNQQEKGKEE